LARFNTDRAAATKKETAFDPVAFASKLQYTEQVEQLGFTEAAAKDFSIGFYRGQVYILIRHSDGSISSFAGYADGQMKLPPKWPPLLPTRRVRKKRPAKMRGFLFTSFSYVWSPTYPWSCQSRSDFAHRLLRRLCLLRHYCQPRYRLYHPFR
jgi:hypothetical protein